MCIAQPVLKIWMIFLVSPSSSSIASAARSRWLAETGVRLQGRAVGGRKVLSLRGMDSRHTLFLVDGRHIGATDGAIGDTDFQYDWIAVGDIERIAVVRGPLSVLHASEAMGGAT
jgi:outer membrane receptor for ferrienterochelin and colicin